VTFFGNVQAGMQYVVSIDGTNSTGTPSGNVLASISGLSASSHTVSIIASVADPSSGATLLLEGASVTVGTGLTG
jgi:hypothetical protein